MLHIVSYRTAPHGLHNLLLMRWRKYAEKCAAHLKWSANFCHRHWRRAGIFSTSLAFRIYVVFVYIVVVLLERIDWAIIQFTCGRAILSLKLFLLFSIRLLFYACIPADSFIPSIYRYGHQSETSTISHFYVTVVSSSSTSYAVVWLLALGELIFFLSIVFLATLRSVTICALNNRWRFYCVRLVCLNTVCSRFAIHIHNI